MVVKQTKMQALSVLLLSSTLISGFIAPTFAWSQEAINQLPAVSLNTVSTAAAVSAKIPRMSIRKTFETGDASLYIDLNEVLKIRSSSGKLNPQERVAVVQQRLQSFLQQGGNPRDIKPGEENGQIVIRLGKEVLVTVDAETAGKSKLGQKQLAYMWTNLIRKALGVDPLDRDPNLMASRGFSPMLTQLRNMPSSGVLLRGLASWYGPGFHGRRTSNGERFNMNSLTAAHKTLPFNTLVRVTNKRTGQSAIVRITDRGPFVAGRIIDLSRGAAQAIGMLSSGTAPVTVEVLGR